MFHNQPEDAGVKGRISITVTPKELSLTTSPTVFDGAYTKIYDGTTSLPAGIVWTYFSLGGILPSDVVSVGAITAAFTNKDVEATKYINVSDIALTGADKDNYKLPDDYRTTLSGIETNWQITKRPLGVDTGGVTISKTYDGTKAMPPAVELKYDATGEVGLDDVKLKPVSSTVVEYESSNAGSGIKINYENWDFFDSDPGSSVNKNYSLPLASIGLTGTIEKATLTFNAAPAGTGISKVYDGNTGCDPAKIAATIISGLITAETGKVEVYAISALYDGSDAGTHNVTATFDMKNTEPSPAINYIDNYRLDTTTEILTGCEILKAPVNPVAEIPIQILIKPAYSEEEYPLHSIEYEPVTKLAGMSPGIISYTIDNNPSEGYNSAFFASSGEPVLSSSGDELAYTPVDGIAEGAESTSLVTIESQNYENVTVRLKFIATDKTVLTVGGITLPSDKVYDGAAIGDFSGTPIFYDAGIAITPSPPIATLEYKYTDEMMNPISGKPVDAGVYYLWAKIPDTNDKYMSDSPMGTKLGEVEISRRGLVIRPVNKSVDLGEPFTWNTYADFTAVGLVSGDTLSKAFDPDEEDSYPCGFTVDMGSLDPNVKTPQTVTITGPSIGGDYGKNYKITGYADGTLTINGDIIGSGWITFTPPAPDGSGGWYKSDITAQSTDATFSYIGMSSSGPFTADVTLNVESKTPVTPALYLANDSSVPPALVTSPYSGFSYRLDKTVPEIDDVKFAQKSDEYGILSFKASDVISGIGSVKLSVGGGAEITLPDPDGDGIYNYALYKVDTGDSFGYSITATDVAGNTFTSGPHISEFYDTDNIIGIEVKTSGGGLLADDSLRMELSETAGLVAELTLKSGAPSPPAAILLFEWDMLTVDGKDPADVTILDPSDTTDSKIQITSKLPVYPELAERSTLTVKAMGKEHRIDVSFCTIVDSSDTSYPSIVLPAGVSPDTVLVIEKQKDEVPMQIDMQADSELGALLTKDYPDWKKKSGSQYSNSRWLQMWLMDTSGAEIPIPLGSILEISLPVPGASTSDKDYLMAHQNSGGLDNIPLTKASVGINFSVEELSPFAMIWKSTVSTPAGPGGSGGSSGTGGSSSYPDYVYRPPYNGWSLTNGGAGGGGGAFSYDDFWYQIRNAIRAAKSGDTIIADVPEHINNCPTSVLVLLNGKDVTLQINWQDEEFCIYGKDVSLPEPLPEFYLLRDLLKLYGGLRPVSDLHNPNTGGDDIMIFAPDGNLRLTLPVFPGISKTDRLTHSPIKSAASQSPAGIPSRFIPWAGSNSSSSLPANGWDIITTLAALISFAIIAREVVRGKHLSLSIVNNIAACTVPAAAKPVSKPTPKAAPEVAATPERTVSVAPAPVVAKPVSKPAPKVVATPERTVSVASVPVATKPVSKPAPKVAATPARTVSVAPAPVVAKPVSKPAPKVAATPARTVSAAPVPVATKPVSRPSPKVAAVSSARMEYAMPSARSASPASITGRTGETGQKFFSLIDRHRLLQQDFENGLISKDEYEAQKRKLACCF